MQFLDHLLKNFFVRDIIFLLGGSIFLYAIIENTNLFPVEIDSISGIRIFLFLGFAYILGYMIQEVTAIFRITTIKTRNTKCKLIHLVHKCIHYEMPKVDFDESKLETAKNYIDFEKDNEHLRVERERIILFKNIGTTLGPSLLYSAIIYLTTNYINNSEVLTLGLFLGFLGITLMILGRVKTLRLAYFLEMVYNTMDANLIQKYKRK